ncbi:vacuolar H+-ATPase E subunit [Tieghemostelium lacteum]|uniref:Vacuolar H+-ATPase E subunit n=1 Tax=Tieghemostelium lacteum TaxID=361077 RepID=A0A151ZDY7_TIELA|nr:vacuolar H+-ATPase E subunit [Tieghemostelium lacteum]|eukprot:KYQ92166.1 vacuolar H+-ATPase E subunit [Tieghemostelium lacteum]
MDDTQVDAQLEQMKNFILQEAQDKAAEIKTKAAQEFTSEKGRIFQNEKVKIIKEFEKKQKQIEVQKKINLSNELNKSRLSVLKAREDCIRDVVQEAQKRLTTISENKEKYTQILKNLILQGLVKLSEKEVSIVCRKEDIPLVEKVLKDTEHEYKKNTQKSVNLTIDKERYLPAGPSGDGNKGPSCCGGVILSALEGRIICKNTLDARLEICFDQLTPIIRTTLYGPTPSRKFFD